MVTRLNGGRLWLLVAVWIVAFAQDGISRPSAAGQTPHGAGDYKVLATSKTSTMEKELNEAAEAGFRFRTVMGGETAFGGNEVVAVMARNADTKGRFAYKLLATSKTSTMQRELQAAADLGFNYVGQTVFETSFGGDEVVVILERDENAEAAGFDYRLVATSKTTTLQKELLEAVAAGYDVVGLTVSKTALGGQELVAITRRARTKPAR